MLDVDGLFLSPGQVGQPPPDYDGPDDDDADGPDYTPSAVSASPSDDLICDVCFGTLTYSGRGRKPKRHKKGECLDGAPRTGGAGRPSRGSAGGSAAAGKTASSKVQDTDLLHALTRIAGQVGGGMAGLAPVTGYTIVLESKPAIAGLIKIAEDRAEDGNDAMLEGLRKAAEAMPWVDVGRFGGALVYAIGVDAGRLNPHSLPGAALGVSEAADKAGWQPPQPKRAPQPVDENDIAGMAFHEVPPPAFKMNRR